MSAMDPDLAGARAAALAVEFVHVRVPMLLFIVRASRAMEDVEAVRVEVKHQLETPRDTDGALPCLAAAIAEIAAYSHDPSDRTFAYSIAAQRKTPCQRVHAYAAIVDGFVRAGDVRNAEEAFAALERTFPEAESFLVTMQAPTTPNIAQRRSMVEAQRIYENRYFALLALGKAYAAQGNFDAAKRILHELEVYAMSTRDAIRWSAEMLLAIATKSENAEDVARARQFGERLGQHACMEFFLDLFSITHDPADATQARKDARAFFAGCASGDQHIGIEWLVAVALRSQDAHDLSFVEGVVEKIRDEEDRDFAFEILVRASTKAGDLAKARAYTARIANSRIRLVAKKSIQDHRFATLVVSGEFDAARDITAQCQDAEERVSRYLEIYTARNKQTPTP